MRPFATSRATTSARWRSRCGAAASLPQATPGSGRPAHSMVRTATAAAAVRRATAHASRRRSMKPWPNRFWPGEDPIGRRIRILFSPPVTIVGIVGDVRHHGLSLDPAPEIYLSHTQEPSSMLTMVVRTSGDASQAAGAIRGQIRAVDRDLPVVHMEAIEDVLTASLGRPRFDASLLGAFGGVALAAGHDRDLWGDVVCRRPAHPRDRHSNRARREPPRRVTRDSRPRRGGHTCWDRARRGRKPCHHCASWRSSSSASSRPMRGRSPAPRRRWPGCRCWPVIFPRDTRSPSIRCKRCGWSDVKPGAWCSRL